MRNIRPSTHAPQGDTKHRRKSMTYPPNTTYDVQVFAEVAAAVGYYLAPKLSTRWVLSGVSYIPVVFG
jgi:hypothetical protein